VIKRLLNSPFFIAQSKLLRVLSGAEKRTFYWIIISTTFGVMLEMFSIVMILPIMAQLTGNETSVRIPFLQSALDYIQGFGAEKALMLEISTLIVIVIFKNTYLGWLAYKQSSFGFNVQRRISEQLFRNYLFQPFHYHMHHNSSILIRNCTQEASQVNQYVIFPSFVIISESFLIIGVALLLIFLQPYFTLVNGILLGLAFTLFNRISGKKILNWGYERLSSEGKRIQLIQQGLGAIKEVKLRQSENYFLSAYDVYNRLSSRAGHQQNALQQMPKLFLELLLYVGLLSLVILTVLTHNSIGNLVAALGLFAASVYKLLPSANKVSMSYQSMKFSMPTMDNFITELNLKDAPSGYTGKKTAIQFHSNISLENVSYSYPSSSGTVLHNISLSITKGECIGFLGESGSGKSTLINVILGLLDPQHGSVRIDGVDIRADMAGWNRKIGYVPQSIYLIDDSIRKNVAFGLEDAQINDAAVIAALKKAHLTQFIDSLPDGLDTFVGERGIRLSGGQIQRIGIARALYHDPDVLILDEATSALDYTTENSIMEAIEILYGTKTIMIVAHRLSTLEKCDRLYRMENGELFLERK